MTKTQKTLASQSPHHQCQKRKRLHDDQLSPRCCSSAFHKQKNKKSENSKRQSRWSNGNNRKMRIGGGCRWQSLGNRFRPATYPLVRFATRWAESKVSIFSKGFLYRRHVAEFAFL